MLILFFAAAAALAAAPSIRLEPEVIVDCRDGAGAATVFWDSDGPAPVTVFAGESPLNGAEPATGSAQTGFWITDGLPFTLRDSAGRTLASVRAAVRCGSRPWWPLAVGNEWHFRWNSRTITGAHAVWRVARKESVNGVEWAVLSGAPSTFSRLRADAEGRLYIPAANGADRLLLDPLGLEPGLWNVSGRRTAAETLAGTFPDELTFQGAVSGLERVSGRLVRGVGPSYYQIDVVAGSSGGFGSGYTLLEVVAAGGARFRPNYPGVELLLESKMVDFASKSARNCAVPCYFVACFGADSPGTYKPCIEASVRGADRLTLLDPAGNPVYETNGEGWMRIPLYRPPAIPLPAGVYGVRATGAAATVLIPLEIK
jgi:hypothetical protein